MDNQNEKNNRSNSGEDELPSNRKNTARQLVEESRSSTKDAVRLELLEDAVERLIDLLMVCEERIRELRQHEVQIWVEPDGDKWIVRRHYPSPAPWRERRTFGRRESAVEQAKERAAEFENAAVLIFDMHGSLIEYINCSD